jgi:phosphate transport system substrate-binding protein
MPRASFYLVALLVLGLVGPPGCGGIAPTRAPTSPDLTGAGATLPYPLYSKWVDVYEREAGVRINYQSIGSGGGIRQLLEGTVDFGASDVPLTDAQLAASPRTILHIPTVVGGVAIVYNVPGIEHGLKLERAAIVDLFLGRITRWSDPRLASGNPSVSLPDTPVAVVHRADGSGTTAVLTEYLSGGSPVWQKRVGTGMSVNWPVGLGAKGSEGVSGQIRQLPGSIGYVELAYAIQGRLDTAFVENRDGHFVAPTVETTAAAAANARVPVDLRASIVDAPGELSYPIATFTYLLVYREQTEAAKARALIDFLRWTLNDGQRYAASLEYAPLPQSIVALAEARVATMELSADPPR